MNLKISGLIKRAGSLGRSEEGVSLVEMALSCIILIPVLFGIIELSIGLYCYHYAADAAREGSRWAMVRGGNCNGNFNAAYCSPTDASATGATANDISKYVTGLGYPFSGSITVTSKWCPMNTGGPPTTWSTTCSTTSAGNNVPSNTPQVQVTVNYAYPLIIPFLPTYTINLHSTSSMVIVQ